LRCSNCGEDKPKECFNRRNDRPRGYSSQCKSCIAPVNYENIKRWRAKNKGKRTEEARRYRKKHPDKIKVIKSRHRERHIEMVRQKDRMAQAERRKTLEYKKAQLIRSRRFKAQILLLQEQVAGRPRALNCELCGRVGGGVNGESTVFDHDHKTRKFRGWLCHWCNRTLGMVKDDPALLRKMIIYLEQGGTQNGKEVGTSDGNEERCTSLPARDSAGPKDSPIYS
jgi:uncharacterized ferredoxin-like protein